MSDENTVTELVSYKAALEADRRLEEARAHLKAAKDLLHKTPVIYLRGGSPLTDSEKLLMKVSGCWIEAREERERIEKEAGLYQGAVIQKTGAMIEQTS